MKFKLPITTTRQALIEARNVLGSKASVIDKGKDYNSGHRYLIGIMEGNKFLSKGVGDSWEDAFNDFEYKLHNPVTDDRPTRRMKKKW